MRNEHYKNHIKPRWVLSRMFSLIRILEKSTNPLGEEAGKFDEHTAHFCGNIKQI